MSAAVRSPIRAALAALLSAALTGGGNPVQAVYDGDRSTFAHEAPVVTVRAAGSRRRQRKLDSTKGQNTFAFAIQVYVPDAIPDGSWTDDQAEDALDSIEAKIADVVLANRRAANWLLLDWDEDFSAIESGVQIGSLTYKRETIILTTMVYDT